MQDSQQNNTDDKQYFDIKGPSQPDPTSRPVINGEPLQTDPMVSVATPSEPSQEPEPSSDLANSAQPSSGVSYQLDTPDATTDTETDTEPEVPEQDPASIDIPNLPGGGDPSAVEYKVPEAPDTSENTASEPDESSPETDKETTSSDTTADSTPTSEASAAEPEASAEASGSSEPTSDTDSPETSSTSTSAEETPVTETPSVADAATTPADAPAAANVITQSKPTNKHGFFKDNLLLKTIIAVLLLILIGLTVFFVYKYKSGQ